MTSDPKKLSHMHDKPADEDGCNPVVGETTGSADQSEPASSQTASNTEYDVGYKKPPKSGQFKPGKSGNPKGRKKGPKTVPERLDKILGKKITMNTGSGANIVTVQEGILHKIVSKALKGDLASVRLILDLQKSHQDKDSAAIDTSLLEPENNKLIQNFMDQLEFGEALGDGKQSQEEPDVIDQLEDASKGAEQ